MFSIKKIIIPFLLIGILVKGLSAQSVGILYGLSYHGGSASNTGGTLFSYDPINGKDSLLVSFNMTTGEHPKGNLIQARNGLLYGLTSLGGQNDSGTIFSYNTFDGTISTLLSFNDTLGYFPLGSLMQAIDGKLYGMTQYGGTNNDGVLFSFDPTTLVYTVLINFNGTTGMYPYYGALVQGNNGFLYGTTSAGGASNDGVFFRYDPIAAKDTILINFKDSVGDNPYGSPIVTSNGNIYGMNFAGIGPTNGGVIFSHDPVTLKDTFILNLNSIGLFHYGGLLQASDGLLYVMESAGGTNHEGTIFNYSYLTGSQSLLISFNAAVDGSVPNGNLIQASNGRLYGMTQYGGANNYGTLISYDIASGKDTVLYNFDDIVGGNALGDLLEAMTCSITGRDTVNCYGDSSGWVKIITRGAKIPLTYSWNNGSTNDSIGGLKPGAYSCAVSDASGKKINVNVTVVQPAKFSVDPVIYNGCVGNSDSAWAGPAGGTPPYSYLWTTGTTTDTVRGLPLGIDSCTVTDAHGCIQYAIVTVAHPPPLKIDSVVSTRPSCYNCTDGSATVYVSGGIPPGDSNLPGYQLLYLWTYGGDSSTVHGIPFGIDSITVTNECGSVVGFTDIPLGLNSLNDHLNLAKIYPIPSKGIVSIEMYGTGFENVIITDELGREVYTNILDASQYNITLHPDLSIQPNGIYIVQILTERGVITRKLIIEK